MQKRKLAFKPEVSFAFNYFEIFYKIDIPNSNSVVLYIERVSKSKNRRQL